MGVILVKNIIRLGQNLGATLAGVVAPPKAELNRFENLIIRIQGSGKSTAKLSELQITRSRSSDKRYDYQPKCVVDGRDELS